MFINNSCSEILSSLINNIGRINFKTEIERNEYANRIADAIIELSKYDDLQQVWEFYPVELEETAKVIKKIHQK